MKTIHDEPIEVLRDGDAPAQFLLGDRLYVVRDILAHWMEPTRSRRPVPERERRLGGDLPLRLPTHAGVVPPAARTAPSDEADRELWRVAAAAGRCAPLDVYDLCRSHEDPGWTASRVQE